MGRQSPSACSTVAIAEPAAAAPPEFSSFDEQGEFPIECDGFTINVNATAHVTVRTFFDSTGDVQRVSVKLTAVDVLTNNVTEQQVVNRGVFEEMFTRIGDTEEFSHTLVGFRYMAPPLVKDWCSRMSAALSMTPNITLFHWPVSMMLRSSESRPRSVPHCLDQARPNRYRESRPWVVV